MKKIIVCLLVFLSFSLFADTLNVSKEELALIKKALRVYRSLHAGNGKLLTIRIENKNGMAIIKRALIIDGEKFNFVDSIKLSGSTKKNRVLLSAGGGLSLFYTRDLFSCFLLQAGLISIDGRWYAQGGVGFKF